jgi:DNA-binding transcriptional ArsR family regulator
VHRPVQRPLPCRRPRVRRAVEAGWAATHRDATNTTDPFMSTKQDQPTSDPMLDASAQSPEPTRDELFHVLRNRRRRFAIHHLERADEPVDVGELATQIAAWENDVPTDAVTSKQRRRVYNALQQTHVPALDETGLVERDRREVELTERAAELDVYLELVDGRDVPWSEYYLGVAGVGALVTGLTAFDFGPFAAVPDVAAAVFLVVVVLVSAAANYHYQHGNRLGEHDRPPELRGD